MKSSMLAKAFAVVEALGAVRGALALSEVATRAALNKPTAHRILSELAGMGYVEKVDVGKYQLTGKLWGLRAGAGRDQLLIESEPVLTKLRDQTGETVNLGVLHQDRVIYLRVIESTHALRRFAEPGAADPFFCTALGRVLAAHLSTSRQKYLIENAELTAYTANTVTDPDQLMRILRRVRKDGYAIENGETDIGVTCIGVPVMDGTDAIAGISVSSPVARLNRENREQLLNAVVQAGESLSKILTDQAGGSDEGMADAP